MIDKRYDILLEVVTPLAVGAGNDNDWIKGADFIQKDGRLYVLDLAKVMALDIDTEKLASYLSTQREDDISLMIGDKIETISKYIFDLPVKTDNPVKSFLRTQLYDKPIVAGSSVKGAVRSALFNFLRNNERNNQEVFGALNRGADFMRFIKIGDFEMKNTILANTKIFNLMINNQGSWVGGWKQSNNQTTLNFKPTGFNTLYECVPPGEQGMGTLSMASGAFHLFLMDNEMITPYSVKKKTLMNEGIFALFKVINAVTADYLRKERHFFTTFESDRTDEIVDSIDLLLSLIPDDNSSCLMKMSAGAGFHSITGNWQFDDFSETGTWQNNGKMKYKSRKIVEYANRLSLMGFIKMYLLSENEEEERRTSLKKYHDTLLEEIRLAVSKREEQERLAKEQRRLKEEKEKEVLRIRTEYYELIAMATTFYYDNKNVDAMETARKAEKVWPDGSEHQSLISKIQTSINIEEERKAEEQRKIAQLSQPLVEVLSGKTSIGNILGHLGKWCHQNGNIIGEQELRDLFTVLSALPKKEIKKLPGTKNRFVTLIGEDKATVLFDMFDASKK